MKGPEPFSYIMWAVMFICVGFMAGDAWSAQRKVYFAEPVCRCLDGGFSGCAIHLGKHHGWFGCIRDEVE
jgi:hypothetical protein